MIGGKDRSIGGMLKALSFSLFVSIISLFVVLLFPLNISEPVEVPESPFASEIEELRGKEFLSLEESQKLHDLVEKQNEYLLYKALPKSRVEQTAWIRKSTVLSPLIALIWFLSYRFYVNRTKVAVGVATIPVLIVPFLLAIIGAMSIIEMCLIFVAVLFVMVWRQIGAVRSNN